MAEAGNVIETQLAGFPGEVNRKIFDVFFLYHIPRFRFQLVAIFQLQ